MTNKSKWIIAGTIVVVLVVGLILGAIAVTLIQRTVWGYPRAYATNNFMPRQDYGDYAMPGPMMRSAPRWNGGPMAPPNSFRGRGSQDNFGPGMMGRGNYGPMMGLGRGWDGATNSLIAIAAEKLDMTTAELATELKSGKTIADLAKEKDVSLDSLVEAVMAPRLERMTELVANGVMTQEQVDAMTELMKVNLTARLNGEGTVGLNGPRSNGGRGMMWR